MNTHIRNACITINNTHTLPAINTDDVIYYIFGRETASTGTLHLQGYIEFNGRKTLKQIKAILGSQTAHIEKRRGNQKQAIEYCTKEDTQPYTFGTPKRDGLSQVAIDKSFELTELTELILNGSSDWDIIKQRPELMQMYYKYVELFRILWSEHTNRELLHEWAQSIELWPRQRYMYEQLKAQNDRQVLWVTDYEGGNGKSIFAKWLYATEDCVLLKNAKTADIAYVYNGEEYVVFDLSRTMQDKVNYGVIEDMKNGVLFSGKYKSRSKVYARLPKIIILSNFDPNKDALSIDRWHIITWYDVIH